MAANVTYDKNTDYQAKINEANAKGDKQGAATAEMQRNAKIADMNRTGTNTQGYTATNNFTPQNTGGAKPIGTWTGGQAQSSTLPGSPNQQAQPTALGSSYFTPKEGDVMSMKRSGTLFNGQGSYTPIGTYNDSGEMLASDRQQLEANQARYGVTQNDAERQMLNQSNEAIRAKYGYSGGQDGSQYIQLTQEQQQSQAQAVQSVDSIMSGYQQLSADAKSMGNDGLLALAAQWDKMVATLDQVQAQITDQIKGQMNGDDPAMQNAIRLIRDEAERMRKDTLEELNARGLVQSGVYARALSDMNNNELNQVQSAVASRFGDLQTQLNSAVMSLAQTRISALAANQSSVATMMNNNMNNVLNVGLAGLNAQMTARGQDTQNNQFNQQMQYNYAGLKQNQSQFDSSLQFNRDQMSQANQQFYDQLKQEDKQFYDQLSAQQKMAIAGAAGSGGTSLAQQKFDFEKQQYYQGLNMGNQQYSQQQLAAAYAPGGTVDTMISKIKSGAYTVGQVTDIINSQYGQSVGSQIMQGIASDSGVLKVIGSSKGQTGGKTSYTPTTGIQTVQNIPAGYTNIGGGYYKSPTGQVVASPYARTN